MVPSNHVDKSQSGQADPVAGAIASATGCDTAITAVASVAMPESLSGAGINTASSDIGASNQTN